MDERPYRSARVEGPVEYQQASRRGCLFAAIAGVLLAGGFVGLGLALGWTDGHTGLVIGGAGALGVVGAVVVATLSGRSASLSSTMVVDGSTLVGPTELQRFELAKTHEARICGDESGCLVQLSRQDHGLPRIRREDGTLERYDAVCSLLLRNVSAARLRKEFELPAYVEPPLSVRGGDLVLDAGNPAQAPLVDALVASLAQNRGRNTRYQAFAELPWDRSPAPASPPLREIDPGLDPESTFAKLATGDPDPADPIQVVARAHQEVRRWLDQQLGLTPDYVLVDESVTRKLLERETGRAFTLIPIGAGRARARREIFRRSTGGGTTYSRGSFEHAAIVIEAPGLPEPLWVVFEELWEGAHHQLDAAVAFINRGAQEG